MDHIGTRQSDIGQLVIIHFEQLRGIAAMADQSRHSAQNLKDPVALYCIGCGNGTIGVCGGGHVRFSFLLTGNHHEPTLLTAYCQDVTSTPDSMMSVGLC